MAKGDIISAAKTGAWVTASVLVLNYVLTNFLSIPIREVFGITAATGITSTIGTKTIAIMQNLVAFDLMSIIYLFISASLIVLVGRFARSKLNLPQGRTAWQKLALVLLYGTIPFYLLLVGFGLPAMSTIVGIVVYYVLVALVLGGLQKLKVKVM